MRVVTVTHESSGYAAMSVKCNQFVVDNGIDGFDLHQLDSGIRLRTFPTGAPEKKLPKQVEFGENGRLIVGGSDHGAVYVFERHSGAVVEILGHAPKGLVQTLTV